MAPVVATFGEVMVRLTPPGFERFLQSPQFIATFGGAEANVAVSLAQFGASSRCITVLPPHNFLADALIGELRRYGVDASRIVRAPGRMNVTRHVGPPTWVCARRLEIIVFPGPTRAARG